MSPEVLFHHQPNGPNPFADALREQLADSRVKEATAVVAWTRFGGIARIADAVGSFRDAGGHFRVIVGIDENGATRPGLMHLLDVADEVLVYHDPVGDTFHPKVYLFEGPDYAALLVGSNNLTAGGLYVNVEAALEARFSLPVDSAHPALVGVREFIESLRADSGPCRSLTTALIDDLVAQGRVKGSERRPPGEGSSGTSGEAGAHGSEQGESKFLKSKHGRASAPALSKEASLRLAALEGAQATSPHPGSGSGAPAPAVGGQGGGSSGSETLKWSKVLSRSDAQQTPSQATNPTGVVRLSQEKYPIDHKVWFRGDFFGAAVTWTAGKDSRGNAIETAVVPFHVTVAGDDLGVIQLRVTHGLHRVAGQGNVPTVLHWGELGPHLRSADYTGKTLALEYSPTGGYALSID